MPPADQPRALSRQTRASAAVHPPADGGAAGARARTGGVLGCSAPFPFPFQNDTRVLALQPAGHSPSADARVLSAFPESRLISVHCSLHEPK